MAEDETSRVNISVCVRYRGCRIQSQTSERNGNPHNRNVRNAGSSGKRSHPLPKKTPKQVWKLMQWSWKTRSRVRLLRMLWERVNADWVVEGAEARVRHSAWYRKTSSTIMTRSLLTTPEKKSHQTQGQHLFPIALFTIHECTRF